MHAEQITERGRRRLRLLGPEPGHPAADAGARCLDVAAAVFSDGPFRSSVEAALAALVGADRARVLPPGGAPAGSVAELAARTGAVRMERAGVDRTRWVVALPLVGDRPGGGVAVVARAGPAFTESEVGRLRALLRLVAAVDQALLAPPVPVAGPRPPTVRRPATFFRRP